MQAAFLAEALPRVEMKRQGVDPENPSGKGNKGKAAAKEGMTELSRIRREKNRKRRQG